MTQQSSTFSHICRLVPSDPPSHVHFCTENNTFPFFFFGNFSCFVAGLAGYLRNTIIAQLRVTPRNNFKTQIVNLLLYENNQTTGKGPLRSSMTTQLRL
jgi:hypothetical protein